MKPQVRLGEPLTDEQVAEVRRVRDEWIAVGLSTQRCDRPAAEVAVRAAYRAAGLAEPGMVVWMDSPLGGVVAAAAVKEFLQNSRGDQLRGQLRGQLGGQLWVQLGNQLGRELSPWWDAYWLCYYACALPLAGLDNSALDALIEAVRLVGWWWPMTGAVVLTDRPTILTRDEQGRLHSATGPALAYADGYALHFWHGTCVPEWVIENPTIERALAEENTEIRRCAMEHLGWDAVIAHLGVEPLDVCADPGNHPHDLALYRLPETVNPYGAPVNLLLMVNGSPDRSGAQRRYGETVPADITSAMEAAAWQYGVHPDAYAQLVRRT